MSRIRLKHISFFAYVTGLQKSLVPFLAGVKGLASKLRKRKLKSSHLRNADLDYHTNRPIIRLCRVWAVLVPGLFLYTCETPVTTT